MAWTERLGMAALLGALALGLTLASRPAAAQGSGAALPSTCLAVAGLPDGQHGRPYGPPRRLAAAQDAALRVWQAALRPVAAMPAVRISYIGHSAFRITSPDGVSVVTDFFGSWGRDPGGAEAPVPEIVTMNHAHGTHFTAAPDPRIAHVLRGWNPEGGPAQHDVGVGDMRVRNVSTDLYWDGTLREADGNSIFVMEAAGLCIGHLGHLHHKLTPEHLARIGRIDVLFVPVDGTYTMSQAGMIELAGQLRASIVIPMHWFSYDSLERFLAGMEAGFGIVREAGESVDVALDTLPASPQVRVLTPR